MPSMIHHDPDSRSFRSADGAILSYTVKDGRHYFDHTEVPTELRGQGVAALLASAALKHARDSGWRVVPACSYIARYLQRHPEFAGIVDTGETADENGGLFMQ